MVRPPGPWRKRRLGVALGAWPGPATEEGGSHALSSMSQHHDLGDFHLGFPRPRASHAPLPHLRRALLDARVQGTQPVTARPSRPASAKNSPLAASSRPQNFPLAANNITI